MTIDVHALGPFWIAFDNHSEGEIVGPTWFVEEEPPWRESVLGYQVRLGRFAFKWGLCRRASDYDDVRARKLGPLPSMGKPRYVWKEPDGSELLEDYDTDWWDEGGTWELRGEEVDIATIPLEELPPMLAVYEEQRRRGVFSGAWELTFAEEQDDVQAQAD